MMKYLPYLMIAVLAAQGVIIILLLKANGKAKELQGMMGKAANYLMKSDS